MKNNQTYWFFWIWIPLLLLLGILFNKEMDIQMHDTYWITTNFQLAFLCSILLLFSGLGYFVFRNLGLNSLLTKLHLYFFVIGVITIVVSIFIQLWPSSDDYLNVGFYKETTMVLAIGVLLIFIGFIFYFLNMLLTGINKINQK